MRNLKTLMNRFKDDKYKFFYVDTQTSQVIRMTKTLTDGIVEEYNELVKLNTENETRTYILKEYVDPCNIDDDIKKWFEGYEDDYDYMYKYYSDVYDVFSKLNFFDNGKLDTEILEKFNEDYDCDPHKIHVSLFYKDDPRVVYIKFEKEIFEDEDC